MPLPLAGEEMLIKVRIQLATVPPTGFEPVHMPSEGNALSPELRGLLGGQGYQRVQRTTHTEIICP